MSLAKGNEQCLRISLVMGNEQCVTTSLIIGNEQFLKISLAMDMILKRRSRVAVGVHYVKEPSLLKSINAKVEICNPVTGNDVIE
jgi:hypothetical protein